MKKYYHIWNNDLGYRSISYSYDDEIYGQQEAYGFFSPNKYDEYLEMKRAVEREGYTLWVPPVLKTRVSPPARLNPILLRQQRKKA
jgi:hypothetical protein